MSTTDWATSAQAATVATAIRRGETWTLRDISELQQARALGFSVSECAVLTGRTYFACQTMLTLLNRGSHKPAATERSRGTETAYRGWLEGMDEDTGLRVRGL